MKRRDVKRSYDFSNYSTNSSARPRLRSHSGVSRKGSYFRRFIKFSPYLIIAGIVFYVFFISSFFQVGNINVQGPNNTLSQQLNQKALEYMDSRLFGRNWLLINEGELKRHLQNTFTGQETVVIKKSFPNKLTISTDEQKTSMLWKTGTRVYGISPNGFVINEKSKNEANSTPIVHDSSNLPAGVGSKVVSRDFVIFVSKVNKYVQDNKIEINQLFVKDTTSELTVDTKQGYEIRLATSQDPDSQMRALKATLESLKQQSKKPTSYIDLRVPGRAFYK